jgi:23S rRNA (uracil1939-C5)-methyltransferase
MNFVENKKTSKRDSDLESLLHSKHTVTVEKMAVGGSAVARIQFKERPIVVFIPFGAPDDKLEIQIMSVEKNFLTGQILKILKPGVGRRVAPCVYFEKCGGCLWQHLEEIVQIEQKEILLKDLLKKFVSDKNYVLLQTIQTPERFEYRNRIQLKQLNQHLGYFRHESHDIVPIENCLIAEKPIQNKISELIKTLRPTEKLKKWEIKINQNHQPEHYQVGQRGEGISFSQVNRFINKLLVEKVVTIVEKLNPTTITEFYAGAGNFTLAISEKCQKTQITAVELGSELVKAANQEILRLKKQKLITFFTTTCENFCRSHYSVSNELVILDPPRSGCHEDVIHRLNHEMPKSIIYISCHPVNLARDLSLLNKNYQITHLQIFDMFPQTDHFETLCILERST